jgi:D-alanyl-D-alanine dipeptidase
MNPFCVAPQISRGVRYGKSIEVDQTAAAESSGPPGGDIQIKSVAPSLLSTSVTPVRTTPWRLDMGTGYDCFDPMAHLMASGLTGQQRANRMLLALLMAQAGFAG